MASHFLGNAVVSEDMSISQRPALRCEIESALKANYNRPGAFPFSRWLVWCRRRRL